MTLFGQRVPDAILRKPMGPVCPQVADLCFTSSSGNAQIGDSLGCVDEAACAAIMKFNRNPSLRDEVVVNAVHNAVHADEYLGTLSAELSLLKLNLGATRSPKRVHVRQKGWKRGVYPVGFTPKTWVVYQ
jgi:hypothetical protein